MTIFSAFRLMLCLRFLAADIPKFGVNQVPSMSFQSFSVSSSVGFSHGGANYPGLGKRIAHVASVLKKNGLKV